MWPGLKTSKNFYQWLKIIRTWGDFLEQVALLEDQQMRRRNSETDAVTLMTLHAAKGLEFPTVFLSDWKKACSPIVGAC